MAGPAVLFQAGDHASRPANGSGCVLYSCTDHDLVYVDDGSAWSTFMTLVGGSGGDIATDAIWDAAGDLAVGSGANTAAKLAIGATNGMTLARVSGAVAWALPPGYELDYAQTTTGQTDITATSEASANTIVTGNSVTYAAAPIIVRFNAADAQANTANGDWMQFILFDGSSAVGVMGFIMSDSANNTRIPVHCEYRLTPTAAAHTYSIRGIVSAGTGKIYAGSGGAGARIPVSMRITKV